MCYQSYNIPAGINISKVAAAVQRDGSEAEEWRDRVWFREMARVKN